MSASGVGVSASGVGVNAVNAAGVGVNVGVITLVVELSDILSFAGFFRREITCMSIAIMTKTKIKGMILFI